MNLQFENNLWIQVKKGDLKSFRIFFDYFYNPLCRCAYLVLDNKMDAEDIVQEFFSYLYENSCRISISTSIRSYLFASVRNRALNHLRKSRKVTKIEEYENIFLSDECDNLDFEVISEIIERTVANLPEKCREVFIRSRKDNMKDKEIADDMNISIKTVNAQKSIALKRIKKSLDKIFIIFFNLF